MTGAHSQITEAYQEPHKMAQIAEAGIQDGRQGCRLGEGHSLSEGEDHSRQDIAWKHVGLDNMEQNGVTEEHSAEQVPPM